MDILNTEKYQCPSDFFIGICPTSDVDSDAKKIFICLKL
jgi:hypothetical protein